MQAKYSVVACIVLFIAGTLLGRWIGFNIWIKRNTDILIHEVEEYYHDKRRS